ncbi:DUF2470 domain-containing protein [Spongisporangium articulatum]|uniref:DUF2470 domain-containing protein n=1 Tax=Spongisporangium articulatum TaxID=3362603 RepID=A0ABW8ARR1_9ACTN
MDTRLHPAVRPSPAERARTVLAAAASLSVQWEGGRVDLLGCHHDDPVGDLLLTLEPSSALAAAAQQAAGSGEDLTVEVELTELCPVAARERVRARVSLFGRLSPVPAPGVATLQIRVHQVHLHEVGRDAAGEGTAVDVEDYRQAPVDPLQFGAADQLQHLMSHHPEAIGLLTRLCDASIMQGATRVLPIALDRFGLVLRVESARGHVDVRLTFSRCVESVAGATEEIRRLMLEAHRRRPCLRKL